MANQQNNTQLVQLGTASGEDIMLAARLDGETYPRLCNIDHEEAVALMASIVMMAQNYRGQHSAPDGVRIIAASLVDELLRNDYGTASITFAEIREVIRKEALMQEDYYVSVSSLYRSLVAYAKGLGAQLQSKAAEINRRRRSEELRQSVVGTMVAAYSTAMIKSNNQNKKR